MQNIIKPYEHYLTVIRQSQLIFIDKKVRDVGLYKYILFKIATTSSIKLTGNISVPLQ
jgi:hypothetical protein